ncbi:hypothetical protein ACFE04_028075 [Oxalis oulophora]
MNQNYRDPEITIPESTATSSTTTPRSSNPLLHDGRYSCFCFPSSWFETVRRSAADHEGKWWARTFLKVREWSELVAGPKWKTFIRRFNRSRSGGGHHHHQYHGKFQYDPLSYSLNFDEGGANGNSDSQEEEFRDFSTRFAAAPTPVKPLTAAIAASG